jgi:decaprenyl-phosphate phosphoribosyltransferase
MIPLRGRKRLEGDSNAALNSSAAFSADERTVNPYWVALRPHQWTKNLVVFAASLFSFRLTWQVLSGSLLAFILFCIVSSSFYLINDIVDVEADRRHPTKCKRPIAAGLVSIPAAMVMAASLLLIGLLVAWATDIGLGIAISGYAVLQVGYNFRLKRMVILDVIAIAVGFVLRAYGGATAADIVLSSWFLLCTAMLAMFLGVEKRKAELRLAKVQGGTTRAVLQLYSLPLLSRMESIVTSGAIITYAIWSSGPQVNGASTPWMMLTLPFVLYGIFRYQFLSDVKGASRRKRLEREDSKSTERPEEILLTDRAILLTVILWIIVVLVILLSKHQGLIQ